MHPAHSSLATLVALAGATLLTVACGGKAFDGRDRPDGGGETGGAGTGGDGAGGRGTGTGGASTGGYGNGGYPGSGGYETGGYPGAGGATNCGPIFCDPGVGQTCCFTCNGNYCAQPGEGCPSPDCPPVPCGPALCAPGDTCCDARCGICAPPGTTCASCPPPPPPPPADAGSLGPRCGRNYCGEGQTCCDAPCGVCAGSPGACGVIDYNCVPDCSPMEMKGNGGCALILGYTWNGYGCTALSGCACEGTDCGLIFHDPAECTAAFSRCPIPL